MQPELDKAAWFRSRKIVPERKPQDAIFNADMERQAQHFEAKVADVTAQVAVLLAEAEAAHAAALAALAQADAYAAGSIAATQAAIQLTQQAEAAEQQASQLQQQAIELSAQAEALAAQAEEQEALAIERREAETAYLVQAQDLYADEQDLLAEAEAADLTDEADAAHQLALAAEAAAAQAEQRSIAATQQALALDAQAGAQDAVAATETQLAAMAQAEADYLAGLQGQPGSVEETLFAYDLSGHLIGEYAADGTVKVEYAWLEDLPLAQLRDDGSMLGGTAIYWYQADHLNTPTQLTDRDRQVVWDAVREPFGKVEAVTSTVSNNLQFPGQYEDAETGLHYNYFRDYDPSLGRYVESDPIGLAGGTNLFGYTMARPTSLIDPLGLRFCECSFQQGGPSRNGDSGSIACYYSCKCECDGEGERSGHATVSVHAERPAPIGCPNARRPPNPPNNTFPVIPQQSVTDFEYGAGFGAEIESKAAESCRECSS